MDPWAVTTIGGLLAAMQLLAVALTRTAWATVQEELHRLRTAQERDDGRYEVILDRLSVLRQDQALLEERSAEVKSLRQDFSACREEMLRRLACDAA